MSDPLVRFTLAMVAGYIPINCFYVAVKIEDTASRRKMYTNLQIFKIIVQALLIPPYFISAIENPQIGINEQFCGIMKTGVYDHQNTQCPLWDVSGAQRNDTKFDLYCQHWIKEHDPDHEKHMSLEVCKGNGCDEYRGKQTKTVSGKECQRWDSEEFQKHKSIMPETFPESGLDENYCRNPDGEKWIWCFTTDPDTRYEECKPLPRQKVDTSTPAASLINMGNKMQMDKMEYQRDDVYVEFLRKARCQKESYKTDASIEECKKEPGYLTQLEVEFLRVEQCKTSIGIALVIIFVLFQIHNGYQASNSASLKTSQENADMVDQQIKSQKVDALKSKTDQQEKDLKKILKNLQELKKLKAE